MAGHNSQNLITIGKVKIPLALATRLSRLGFNALTVNVSLTDVLKTNMFIA
jgi:hypothetical protein